MDSLSVVDVGLSVPVRRRRKGGEECELPGGRGGEHESGVLGGA